MTYNTQKINNPEILTYFGDSDIMQKYHDTSLYDPYNRCYSSRCYVKPDLNFVAEYDPTFLETYCNKFRKHYLGFKIINKYLKR